MAKRRLRGEGSVYQRADGMWVGAIDLGWHNHKRIRKTVSGKTLKITQEKFKALKSEVEKGYGLSEDLNVEEWMNHWLKYIANERVRPTTLQGYAKMSRVWIVPYLGKYRLNKLKEDHIRALYREMKVQKKSTATIYQCHAVLSRALTVALQESRITRNPAGIMDAPKVEKNHRLPLTLAEAKKVLACLDGNPLAARWVAALLMGMRQGECLGLKWEDIDFEAKTISIKRGLIRLNKQGISEAPPKTATSIRTIPMLAPMEYALLGTEKRGEYVFYGKKQDSKKDWKNWKELLIHSKVCDAGMEFGEMPDLAAARTTAATLLRDAGVDGTVVRDILGHSQVQVTQESYQRTDMLAMKKAMKALESSVKEKKKV
jgi:integrase